MKRKLIRLFKSKCNSTTEIDARFRYVYINDELYSSNDNGAYLVGNDNGSYTLFLWQRGMLLTKKPILLTLDFKRGISKIGVHLKDDDNRKYFISEDMITVCEQGLITEYTNKKS